VTQGATWRNFFCANEKPEIGMSQHYLVYSYISSFNLLILLAIFPMVDPFLLAGLY
jgi:hypothetical protein